MCDFGIAKATPADGDDDRSAMLTVQGLVCGTPEYMSPEQARAEPLDGRADLYSAAVILYQLVTGRHPVPRRLADGHHQPPPGRSRPTPPSRAAPRPRIPPAVDDIVLRGLEKNRELRFPTAVAFRDAIEAMLERDAAARRTPLPPSVRAAMPTARDMTGRRRRSTPPTVPARAAGDASATTADLTGRRPTRQKVAGARRRGACCSAARPRAAIADGGPRRAQTRDDQRAPAAAVAAPVARARGRRRPRADARRPPPPARAAAPRDRPRRRRSRRRPRRGRASRTASGAPSTQATDTRPPDAAPAPARRARAAAAAPPPARPAAPPPSRGAARRAARARCWPRRRSCSARARSATPARAAKRRTAWPRSLPAVHKFLGKCYMRAGRTREANDNYKQYLELAPNAPDAPFVKSMIK